MSEHPLTRRPQLSLDELHQLRWLLGGILTLLSAWTILYLDIDAWALTGAISVATICVLLWPKLPGRVPTFLHTFAFPIIVAFFLGDLWLKGDALPAIVRLDMLLLLYRAISYRQRRDDLQIIVLGLFLIVVAGVLTVSIAFAVQLLAFAACALGLLLVLTLLQAMEDGGSPGAKTGEATVPTWVGTTKWSRLFARLRKATDWRVVVLGGVLFAGVVALSALLFVAIPRFQLENSLFLERFVLRKARTGFSESIKFGDVTEIQQDTRVALSIDVADRSQMPAAPYWRMLVLDQYENGTFKLSAQLRTSLYREQTRSAVSGAARGLRRDSEWIFYLESGVSRYLPLLGAFSELRFTELQVYQFSSSLGLLALRNEPATMTAYQVDWFEAANALRDEDFARAFLESRKVAAPFSGALTWQVGLGGLAAVDQNALRETVEKVMAQSTATGGENPSASVFIQRANAWLRENHGYSLSPRVPGGPGDPLVRWMTSREAGHCELFAGSLVLLARAAGLPARVVTGFRGGSWNTYSGNLTVRNSDAHAWAEIFDEATSSWLRADALAAPVAAQASLAADANAPQQARQVDQGWSARMESLRIFWYRRIVSFDQQAQVETLKAIKTTTEDSGRRLRAVLATALAEIKSWMVRPWDVGRIFRVFALAAALIGAAWAWREFGSRAWRRWLQGSRGRAPDPVRMDASRWLKQLSHLETTESETKRLVDDLQRLRFGARPSWPEPKKVFRTARRIARSGRRRTRES